MPDEGYFGDDNTVKNAFARASGSSRSATEIERLLFAAIESGDDATVVKLLIEAPECANRKNAALDGKTPLMFAAEKGQINAVLALLPRTDDIDAGNSKGSTALILAAFNGHAQIVSLLIEEGADIDLANGQGVTPLMAASWSGNLRAVTDLIEEGADVDATDNQGMSAVLYCTQNGHVRVLRALADGGADLHVTSDDGMNLAAAAETSESPDMMVMAERLQREYTGMGAARPAKRKKKEAPKKRKADATAVPATEEAEKPTEKKTAKEEKPVEKKPEEPEKSVNEIVAEIQDMKKKAIENINTPKPPPPTPEQDRLGSLTKRLKKAGFD